MGAKLQAQQILEPIMHAGDIAKAYRYADTGWDNAIDGPLPPCEQGEATLLGCIRDRAVYELQQLARARILALETQLGLSPGTFVIDGTGVVHRTLVRFGQQASPYRYELRLDRAVMTFADGVSLMLAGARDSLP